MFTLKGRQDRFRLLLPKDFIPKQIEEKYDLTKDDNEMITYIYDQVDNILFRYLKYFMKNHIKEPIKEDDE